MVGLAEDRRRSVVRLLRRRAQPLAPAMQGGFTAGMLLAVMPRISSSE